MQSIIEILEKYLLAKCFSSDKYDLIDDLK